MEDRRRAEIERGNHAKQLLEDPMLLGALVDIEAEILSEWRNSSGEPPEVRERAWLTLNMLDEFRRRLRVHLERGRAAQHEDDLQHEREERAQQMSTWDPDRNMSWPMTP